MRVNYDYETGITSITEATRFAVPDDVIQFSVLNHDLFVAFGDSTVVAAQDDTAHHLVVGTEWINVPTGATHYSLGPVEDAGLVNVTSRTTPIVEYGT